MMKILKGLRSASNDSWELARKTALTFTKGDVIKLVVDNQYVSRRGKNALGTVIDIREIEKDDGKNEVPHCLFSILWETGELLDYNELITLQICKINDVDAGTEFSQDEVFSKLAPLTTSNQVKAVVDAMAAGMKSCLNQGMSTNPITIKIPVTCAASHITLNVSVNGTPIKSP